MKKNNNKYIIGSEFTTLIITDSKNRKIKTIVDNEKVDELKQYSFRANGNGYIKTQNNIYLHQIVIGKIDKGKEIDHINRNKLDNRLCNLRVCSHKDNCKNRLLKDLQGISKLKRLKSKPYQVRVNNIHYGYFATLEEAINIRNKIYKESNKEYSPI